MNRIRIAKKVEEVMKREKRPMPSSELVWFINRETRHGSTVQQLSNMLAVDVRFVGLAPKNNKEKKAQLWTLSGLSEADNRWNMCPKCNERMIQNRTKARGGVCMYCVDRTPIMYQEVVE